MRSRALLVGRTACAISVAFVVACASPAHAQTAFTVDSCADEPDRRPGDGLCETRDGTCTLRAAVEEANTSGGSETATISVPAGEYVLVRTSGTEPAEQLYALSVTGDVAISGAGAAATKVLVRSEEDFPKLALRIAYGAVARVEGVTFEGSGNKGGILASGRLVVSRCVATGHRGEQAPIGTDLNGELEILESAIFDNEGSAGAIANSGLTEIVRTTVQDNRGSNGAIRNTRRVIVRESAIVGNSGPTSAIVNKGTLSLENSTVSGNRSTGREEGYRATGETIYNEGFLDLQYSTITQNTAAYGSAIHHAKGTLVLAGTIIAGNLHPLGRADAELQCTGGVHSRSGGHNLLGDDSCGYEAVLGDIVAVDPRLAPLAANGGPTLSHEPLPSSPAVDAADPQQFPATDQRGAPRPHGGAADIGAFEFGAQAPPSSPPPLSSPTSGPTQAGFLASHASAGGGLRAVAPLGDLWAVGVGATLNVLRLSSDGDMSVVGQLGMPGVIQGVIGAVPYAYVALDGSIHAVDVSRPERPHEVGVVAAPPTDELNGPLAFAGRTLFAAGQYDYAMKSSSGALQTFDVGEPEHPRALSRLETNAGWFEAMEFSNRRMHIASSLYHGFGEYSSRLLIVDATRPSAMRELGRLYLPAASYDLALDGSTVYMVLREGGGFSADTEGYVAVFDVSAPDTPREIGRVSGSKGALNVEKAGGRLLIAQHADRDYLLGAWTVASDGQERLHGTATLPGPTVDLMAGKQGVAAQLADGSVAFYGLTAEEGPVPVGTYETLGDVDDVAVSGSHAAVTSQDQSSLRIVDATKAGAAEMVWTHLDPRIDVEAVAVDAGNAVFCGSGGLRVAWWSPPGVPLILGEYIRPQFFCSQVAVVDGYALVLRRNASTVTSFSISDAWHPEPGHVSTFPEEIWDIAAEDDILCLSGAQSVYLGRLGSGGGIEELSTLDIGGGFSGDSAVSVNRVYLSRGERVVVLDVADPSQPVELPPIELPGTASAVSAADGYAFVAGALRGGFGRLWVYDVVDPNDVQLIDDVPLPGTISRLVAGSGSVYAAAGAAGLRVFKYPSPASPRFLSPCGRTNRLDATVEGTATDGSLVTVYVDGSPAAQVQAIGSRFVVTAALSAGEHEFTADATTGHGRSALSSPIAISVQPDLAYDPLGVWLTYDAGDGSRGQQPVGRSGCVEASDGWWVRPPPGVRLTVTVPVSYRSFAAVTVTMGSAVRPLTETEPGVFQAGLPAIEEALAGLDSEDVPFVIEVAADGRSVIVPGGVLAHRLYLPSAAKP